MGLKKREKIQGWEGREGGERETEHEHDQNHCM